MICKILCYSAKQQRWGLTLKNCKSTMWVWITEQLNDTWNLAETDAKWCTSEAKVFGSFTFIPRMGHSELTAASQTQKFIVVRPWSSGEDKNPKLLNHWVNSEFLAYYATSRALAQRLSIPIYSLKLPRWATWFPYMEEMCRLGPSSLPKMTWSCVKGLQPGRGD